MAKAESIFYFLFFFKASHCILGGPIGILRVMVWDISSQLGFWEESCEVLLANWDFLLGRSWPLVFFLIRFVVGHGSSCWGKCWTRQYMAAFRCVDQSRPRKVTSFLKVKKKNCLNYIYIYIQNNIRFMKNIKLWKKIMKLVNQKYGKISQKIMINLN